MRFTLNNMIWLTVTVAAVSAVVRLLLPVGGEIVVVLVLGAYLFCPLLLALVSSFFQMFAARTRKLVGFGTLLTLGGLVVLPPLVFGAPGVAILLLMITFSFWAVQMDIFVHVHDSQEVKRR